MADAPAASALADRPPARWPELDVARAVAIAAVVLIHVKRSWLEGQPSRLEVVLDPVLRFAVPTFFFASGALAAGAARRAGFLGGRLRRLLPPYLLASLAAWVVAALAGEPRAPLRMLSELVLGSAFGLYYFVFVLVVLSAAVPPLLARLGSGRLLAVLALLLAAQWWSEVTGPLVLSFTWYLRNPLLWAAYFVAGWIYAGRRPAIAARLAGSRAAAVGAATAWLALVVWVTTRSGEPPLGRTGEWLLLWGQLALLLVLSLALGRAPVWARVLSAASYTVYLWHPFAVYPLRDLWMPGAGELSWRFLLVPWAAGLAAPLLLLELARRVVGAERAERWLGASATRRR